MGSTPSATDAPTLVVATRNPKKARDIAVQLEPRGIRVVDLSEFPHAPVVEETGATFEENATLKATQVARAVGRWTLADDSGLEVDALGGEPGVISARYAGDHGSDADNNRKLLEKLEGLPPERRGAQFVCHLVVADPEGRPRAHVAGHCRGRILNEYRGDGGFGYDPLFLVREYHRTFAELGILTKGCLSHRARAFQKLWPELTRLLGAI